MDPRDADRGRASTTGRRVAVVHDWLAVYGGAERVLAEMLQCFPGADLYVPVDFLRDEERRQLAATSISTSFVQRLPLARRHYWYYMPLMALAVEQFDLSGYDLVISSSHAVAKGVITGPDQLHVSYVHSPMRYVWDLQPRYLEDFGWQRGLKGACARSMFHYLRIWDSRTAAGVDDYVANSAFIARRIEKVYGRRSTLIHPAVDTERFTPGGSQDDFYLTSASANPFKQTALVVEAFLHTPGRRLVVTGDVSDLPAVRAMAGPNVEFLGRVPTGRLVDLMRASKAFIFAAAEDFGIVMAEAQACGTPVVALSRGGAAEIVRPVRLADAAATGPVLRRGAGPGAGPGADAEPTGVLFHEQTVPSLLSALETFERYEATITSQACRTNALRFSAARFRERFTGHVEATWTRWLSGSWSR